MNELTMNETFMRFGGNFQENLCQLMFEDRPFFDQITEVLDVIIETNITRIQMWK